MAEKKVKLERNYIIPLRRATVKIQSYLRAKKAISVIRKFMKRHMKSEDIKIGQELNELIWGKGGNKVPGKVNVTAVKEDNVVNVNLVGIKPKKEETKKEEKKETKKEEEKKEVKKEEKKEEKIVSVKELEAEEKKEHAHEKKHEHKGE
jgi:large subunit ribosomal protein L31e